MKPQTWYNRYLIYKIHSRTPSTIESIFKHASLIDREIVYKILRENNIEEIRCLSCGARLTLADLMYYNHPDGINSKWYFFHCPRCGYDTSLKKILFKARKKISK